jgi:hypothetical protein
MTEEIIPQVVEINCETGEEVYRPMTAEELQQREEDKIAWEAEQIIIQEEKDRIAAAKASAEAKLSALGLTAEEIAAIAK